jgi:pimeloyl-ACP methyl ester carboxylesterase
MRKMRAMRCALLLMMLLTLSACLHAYEPAVAAIEPAPCIDPALEGRVQCGRVLVPENHARPQGRRIALHVVVVPALEAQGGAPLYYIDGGPGSNATRRVYFYLNEGSDYRQDRDVVLFDQRGAGFSEALHCPEIGAGSEPFAPMYGEGVVARCAEALTRVADVTQYTTDASAQDLDQVREALGHDRIDIIAASYGTTLAMHYMAREPARVRSAVFIGAAPWWARPPQDHATAADRALRMVLAQCAADADCRAAYPDAHGDLDRLRARLLAPGSPMREVVMERLRRQLYSPAGARRIPQAVRDIAENGPPAAPGDDEVLPPYEAAFAEGLYIQVICAESFPGMSYDAAAAAARATPFGDYRLRYQRAACRDWPVQQRPIRLPRTRVAAPILFISGDLDPVTPPEWAARAVQDYPNARQVVIPFAGHTNAGLSNVATCFHPLLQRFYKTLDLDMLDASCVADMRPPPFVVRP